MAILRTALCVAVVGAASSVASAATTTYKLSDHPDGSTAPPTYGLRLDGLFTGGSQDTTFSFDTTAGVFLTVTESGGSLEINISGVVQLVEGFGALAGDGLFQVDYTYRENVNAVSNGWMVSPDDPDNYGTISSIDAAGDFSGMSFDLAEDTMDGNSFKFLADGHRLSGDNSSWVGRGWLFAKDANGDRIGSKPQDWLFTADLVAVPAPTAASLGLAGLVGVGARRRRRD